MNGLALRQPCQNSIIITPKNSWNLTVDSRKDMTLTWPLCPLLPSPTYVILLKSYRIQERYLYCSWMLLKPWALCSPYRNSRYRIFSTMNRMSTYIPASEMLFHGDQTDMSPQQRLSHKNTWILVVGKGEVWWPTWPCMSELGVSDYWVRVWPPQGAWGVSTPLV